MASVKLHSPKGWATAVRTYPDANYYGNMNSPPGTESYVYSASDAENYYGNLAKGFIYFGRVPAGGFMNVGQLTSRLYTAPPWFTTWMQSQGNRFASKIAPGYYPSILTMLFYNEIRVRPILNDFDPQLITWNSYISLTEFWPSLIHRNALGYNKLSFATTLQGEYSNLMTSILHEVNSRILIRNTTTSPIYGIMFESYATWGSAVSAESVVLIAPALD